MSYNIFKSYGLDKVKDSLTESFDYKVNRPDDWERVDVKSVQDSDGFTTEYAWYKNGDKHIFMFGDTDITEPDEDYADWVAESEEEARQWFDSYRGFEEDDTNPWDGFNEDDFDEEYTGNANFLNDGFNRVFGEDLDLED